MYLKRKQGKVVLYFFYSLNEYYILSVCQVHVLQRWTKWSPALGDLHSISKFIKRSMTSDCQLCCLFCLPPSRRPTWLVRTPTPATVNGRQEKVKEAERLPSQWKQNWGRPPVLPREEGRRLPTPGDDLEMQRRGSSPRSEPKRGQ